MPATPSPHWLTPAELATWRAFSLMTTRLLSALDAQLQADSKLSYLEYYVLVGLSERPDRAMRMSELAALVDSELSRLSHLIKRLEKRGFVRREPDPTDGRYTNAIMTDEGYAHLVEAAPGHVNAVRNLVFDALDEKTLRTLTEASERMTARIDDRKAAGRPC
jgi:DNA-binding MarR family transcriptional regulator